MVLLGCQVKEEEKTDKGSCMLNTLYTYWVSDVNKHEAANKCPQCLLGAPC